MSDLADAPYIVLLGAPGMGKTVALEQFAKQAEVDCIPAFWFRSKHLSRAGTVFIDALDEVPLQKAIEIAESLEEQPAVRWRVSCRAQGWNEGGNLSRAFSEGFAARNMEPVVAQLQPLSEEETIDVLAAFGCQAPAALLSALHTLRSMPFVRSPLGLKFLMGVQSEQLPSLTRLELYEFGARHFATEHNRAKTENPQGSKLPPDGVLDHAGRVFLTLLLSGTHGVQHISPASDGFLSAHDVGLDPDELASVLDTALFLRKGEGFLPFHRSIQEFLAGRYLARSVSGALGEARLHFERALALLVCVDGLPADGLKALYAWFTCHLVNEGALQHAQRLVRRDPETLLLHGDAATLPVASRTTILQQVGARDPYFRWSPEQWGPAQICTVGLLTPDLIPLVTDLLQTETSPHRLSMLLEALSVWPAQKCISEACWGVALRQSEIQWCREQAITAWLHNASPSVPSIWVKIDELSLFAETQSGHLRSIAQLLCAIPATQLAVADVDRVLAYLRRSTTARYQLGTPQDGRTESVYAIRDIAWHVAERLWRPLILDSPKRWRLGGGLGALEHQFASVLCIAALSDGEVTTEEFAHMMVATGLITGADSSFKKAAEDWLSARPHGEVLHALIVIIDQEVADSGSLAFGLSALGLKPTETLVRQLLGAEVFIANVGVAYVGRQIVNWIQSSGEPTPEWLLPLLQDIPSEAGRTALQCVQLLVEETSERQAQQQESVEQWLLKQIPDWQRQLLAVAASKLEDALYWGAEIYCGSRPITGRLGSGTDALIEVFGEPLAQAITEGLIGVWSKRQRPNTPWDSGAITAASASIRLTGGHDLSGESPQSMLQALFAAGSMRDASLKNRLEVYCIEQLNRAFIAEPGHFQTLASKWDSSWTLFLCKLGEHPERSTLHLWAAREALAQSEKLSGALLDSVLRLAELNVEASELVSQLNTVLPQWVNHSDASAGLITGHDASSADRLRWAYFAVCLQPDTFSKDFIQALEATTDTVIHRIIADGYPQHGYWQTPASTLAVSRLILQFLFQRSPLMQGHFDRVWPDTVKVLKAVSQANTPDVEATLLELIADAHNTSWCATLQHELELYRRDVRAKAQNLFSPTDLAKVFGGRGPVSAQDLRALVLLVLEEIAAELQPSAFNLWRFFWDNKKPKLENDCRDVLADKLRDRLSLYGNFEVSPEAASSGGTRADLLISHGPFTVPIEAKRTNHSHIWYGHSGQLQTYTLASNTEGQGIYVIFWFGVALDVTSSPAGIKPDSPEALKEALEDLLPAALAAKTSMLVLDVSDAAQSAKKRKNSDFDQAKAAKPPRKARAPRKAKKSKGEETLLKVEQASASASPIQMRSDVQ
ncbi:hypothetical protein M3M50_16350 [Pseudomonas bijieensis]|uniref:NACHT domain-containing protein n=1 Tax=Pseudomonas bijieensis TaxID=2681983 RepID=UPI00200FD40D|nr:hypothetical protein [Pseudomonas bijieensis]UQI28546.1 hypothetical protein M3M50_16350 [Pseudomonas bijieensis]